MSDQYAASGVIILHRLFADRPIPAAERGPAAFVDSGRRNWLDLVTLCNAASRGISDPDQDFLGKRVWGSWDGCEVAVVSAAEPPEREWLTSRSRDDESFVMPEWHEVNRRTAIKTIREAARTADVVFIWQPSKLFVGGTMWDNAQRLLEAVHGGGALYGWDDDRVRFAKERRDTAYA